MVKVSKVAAWKIGSEYIEDAKAAEQRVRQLVVEELLSEENPDGDVMMGSDHDVAAWVATNWDLIVARVKEAMAGT